MHTAARPPAERERDSEREKEKERGAYRAARPPPAVFYVYVRSVPRCKPGVGVNPGVNPVHVGRVWSRAPPWRERREERKRRREREETRE